VRRLANHSRPLTIVAALALLACGSVVRTAPTGPHPPALAEPVTVEFPPPPARVELTGPDPGEPCAWMDGHWVWAGRRWHWIPGSWILPPKGCYYAPAATVWYSPPATTATARGRSQLYYSPPRWYPLSPAAQGKLRCAAPGACKGAGKRLSAPEP
jgi:hypothetical protein